MFDHWLLAGGAGGALVGLGVLHVAPPAPDHVALVDGPAAHLPDGRALPAGGVGRPAADRVRQPSLVELRGDRLGAGEGGVEHQLSEDAHHVGVLLVDRPILPGLAVPALDDAAVLLDERHGLVAERRSPGRVALLGLGPERAERFPRDLLPLLLVDDALHAADQLPAVAVGVELAVDREHPDALELAVVEELSDPPPLSGKPGLAVGHHHVDLAASDRGEQALQSLAGRVVGPRPRHVAEHELLAGHPAAARLDEAHDRALLVVDARVVLLVGGEPRQRGDPLSLQIHAHHAPRSLSQSSRASSASASMKARSSTLSPCGCSVLLMLLGRV